MKTTLFALLVVLCLLAVAEARQFRARLPRGRNTCVSKVIRGPRGLCVSINKVRGRRRF